eukprot:1968901-Pyramimonas_sp.AAC.1
MMTRGKDAPSLPPSTLARSAQGAAGRRSLRSLLRDLVEVGLPRGARWPTAIVVVRLSSSASPPG